MKSIQRSKPRDKHARLKNAAVGLALGSLLFGTRGAVAGAAIGGIGNVGFFKGGRKNIYKLKKRS